MIWARLVGWWRWHSPRQLRAMLRVAVQAEGDNYAALERLRGGIDGWLARNDKTSTPDYAALAALVDAEP